MLRAKFQQGPKDMQRMPPTTEHVARNSLDETFFWIPADEKERQAVRAHDSPRTLHGRSSTTRFRARRFADRKHRPLIRIGSL